MSALSAAAQDEDGDIIKTLQARVADLEAQLYAVGAGGVGLTVDRQDHPEQHLDMVPVGWKLVPTDPTPEMIKEMHAYDGTQYSDPFGSDDFKDDYRNMLDAAPRPPAREQPQVEQEPDWTNSETGLLECWKSPLHSMPDRLLMADGAVAFRDKTISNLRLQIASYQSAQQLPAVEHSSAVQPQGAQEPVAFWCEGSYFDTEEEGLKYLSSSNCLISEELTPLYTHPQPKRQPLTDEQIRKIGTDLPEEHRFHSRMFARAIEAAHGIGGLSMKPSEIFNDGSLRGWRKPFKVVIRHHTGLEVKPEAEPIAWVNPDALVWSHRQTEKVVKVTRQKQEGYGFTLPLYDEASKDSRAPMPEEVIRIMCKQPWLFETVQQWIRITERYHNIGTFVQSGESSGD